MGKRTGIAYGSLSRVERGLLLPRDEWIEQIERHYRLAFVDWYPSAALAVIVAPDREPGAVGGGA